MSEDMINLIYSPLPQREVVDGMVVDIEHSELIKQLIKRVEALEKEGLA